MPKFGTKRVLFGYFWARIIKNYSHVCKIFKTPFLVIGPFCTAHSICLNTGLYGNDALSMFVFSTKKRFPSVLKKIFVFQKTYFKVTALKTFKISSNCCIKTSTSLKWRTISNIPSTVLQKNLCSFLGSKMKSLRQSIFLY